MTAIRSSDLAPTLRVEPKRHGPTSDEIRRELLALRARVRSLAEQRARADADRFTQELRKVTEDAARAMDVACKDRRVLAGIHHRLIRRVNADLLGAREDDEASVDARARALLLARLDVLLNLPRDARAAAGTSAAHAGLTLGAVHALRILEQHREDVRDRFRSLKCKLQMELADLSLEMAGETAARLGLRYGREGEEWLWWRLSRIVDQFVAVSTPASLPASLELLATRSVLSGLEKYRKT
jgi:hypothetical protein